MVDVTHRGPVEKLILPEITAVKLILCPAAQPFIQKTEADVAADLFQVGDRAAALGNRKEAPGGPGLLAVVLETRVRREIPVVAEVHLQKPTLIQAEASGKAIAEEKVNLPRAYPEMKGIPVVDLSRAGITG